MGIWARSGLFVSLAVLAACGSVPANSPAGSGTSAPSVAPTSTAPTNAGSPSSSPASPQLAHSSLASTSWISATQGWALAMQPCGGGTCTRFAHTTDAGLHWQALPSPAARIQDGTANCSRQACVAQVSFGSPQVGYLYGPALLMTTDGGRTWHAQPGPQTETLTVAGNLVYRVTYTSTGCPGPCQPSLQAAPVGSTNWRTLIRQLNQPGRSDSAQIVAAGPDVFVAMYGSLAGPIPAEAVVYRSADGGGTWRQVADPCAGLGPGGPKQEEDLIGLAAAPGGLVAGMCAPHNITSTFVITSADAGTTWRPTATAPPGQALGLVAAARPATLAVASGAMSGNGTGTARLVVSTDGGRHWVTAATDTQQLTNQNLIAGTGPAGLNFENALAGQWLGDPYGIWTTTDGGLQWIRAAFP